MSPNHSCPIEDAEEGTYLQESLFFGDREETGSLIFEDQDLERESSIDQLDQRSCEDNSPDGGVDDDSLLQAAALVSIHADEPRNKSPPFTHEERIVILIATVCAVIILPTMLTPTLLRVNESRFPRCGTDAHCDASERCIPDGFNGKSICCPHVFIETAFVADSYQVVCGHLPTNSNCENFDAVCASGFCIGGTCAERGLRRLEQCETNNHCEEGLACQYRSFDDTEKVCCDGSNSGVCIGMPTGTPCDGRARCKSNLCIFGICASSKIPDLYDCEKDGDCVSGSCASDSVGGSRKICCQRRHYVAGSSSVCRDRPGDTFCRESNEVCASGFCINQRCATKQLDKGSECKESADCQSNACALGDANVSKSPVCCEHADTVQIYKDNRNHRVCGQRSTGTYCGDSDHVCQSGLCVGNYCAVSRLEDLDLCSEDDDCKNSACALTSPTTEGNLICCPRGSTTHLWLQDNAYSSRSKVCSNMPAGTHCGNNDEVCQSGFCINFRCAQDGLEESETCEEAAHCKSKACALNDANGVTSTKVCCETAKTVMGIAETSEGTTAYRRLCANRPVGTYCKESNDMCASGLCINGHCAPDRLDDLERCNENDDCKSTMCSLSYASSDAPTVCCKNGKTVKGVLTDTTWHTTVCAGLSAGTACSNIESACESGFCINGTCAMQGLGADEDCLDSNDCESIACARKDARAASSNVCCNSTETVFGELFGGSLYEIGRMCTGQPDGTFCNEVDSMCASGLCINGYCANRTLKEMSSCSEDLDCDSRACSLSFADASAPTICCPGGQLTSGYVFGGSQYQTYAQVCGGLPDGTFCANIGSMCASQLCINQACASFTAESLAPSMNPTALESLVYSLNPTMPESIVPSANPTTSFTAESLAPSMNPTALESLVYSLNPTMPESIVPSANPTTLNDYGGNGPLIDDPG